MKRGGRIASSLILPLFFLTRTLSALVVPLAPGRPSQSLSGVKLRRVGIDGEMADLGMECLSSSSEKVMLVFGTHAADFNTIEYMQRIRYFYSKLQAKGVGKFIMVVNGEVAAVQKLAEILDVPVGVELYADPMGEAGRKFGVSRGWMPDAKAIPAQLKLFVVGIGLGPPWGTLPAVLTGYFGNPNGKRDWLESALLQGQLAGRWPSVLELEDDGESVARNKFDDFPLFGNWGRRPLELATLRLQNLVSIQFKEWQLLKPTDDRCLTQLGGCTVVSGESGDPLFSWIDQGLCDIPDFRDILASL